MLFLQLLLLLLLFPLPVQCLGFLGYLLGDHRGLPCLCELSVLRCGRVCGLRGPRVSC